MEDKKRLLEELQTKQRDVHQLKSQLNRLNAEKEGWFKKKEQVEQKIRILVQELKEAKGKRDTLTKQVKDSKDRRGHLNTAIATKIEELRKLDGEKKNLLKKNKIKEDPSRIQMQIEQL